MYVTAKSGFIVDPTRVASTGDVLEVSDEKAADLMFRDYVRESTPDEVKTYTAAVRRRLDAEAKEAARIEKEAREAAEAEQKRLDAEAEAAAAAAKKAAGGTTG